MSDTDIDQFLTHRPPRKTKLEAWESQIFELLARNATYKTIKQYLKTKDVEVNISSIYEFVKAQKREEMYAKAMQKKGKPIQAKRTQEKSNPEQPAPKESTPTDPSAPANPTPKPTPNALPEFVWNVKNKPKSRW